MVCSCLVKRATSCFSRSLRLAPQAKATDNLTEVDLDNPLYQLADLRFYRQETNPVVLLQSSLALHFLDTPRNQGF